MAKVAFTYKNGKVRNLHPALAEVFQRRGVGTYETRDMAQMPKVQKQPEALSVTDQLDAMEADALRQIATERGLTFHPRLGAEKLRALIREASK